MKKMIYGVLLTVVWLVAPQVQVVAQTDCDITVGFESGTYEGNNVTVTADITNPYTSGINTSAKCIMVKITNSYNNNMVKAVQVTIPEGKTFAEIFQTVKFQVAYTSSNSQAGKDTYIGFSDNGTSWTAYQLGNQASFANSWVERTIVVSTLNPTFQSKTGTFFIGVGVRDGANYEYYMDNVQLVANPDNCSTVNPDEDATLSSLTVNQGTLTPAFNANTTNYTVNVANDVETITIDATATQGSSAVSGIGDKSLNVGANTFIVEVTAPDGITKKEYTIVVTRADENVSCDLSFDFETGSYSGYNATVTSSTTNPNKSGINSSNNCLQVVTSGAYNNNMVKLQITVPDGLTLSQAFETISFQLYASSSLSGKNTYIGVSNDGTSNWTVAEISLNTTVNTTWSERSITISNINNTTITGKTGTFWLGVGIKTENQTTYLMDNVILLAKAGTCPTTYRWTPAASSTDWTLSTNWTPNGTPGGIDKAIILQGASYPALEDDVTVRQLILEPGAALDLGNNKLSASSIKAQISMDARKWYSIGFPFDVATVYSEDYNDVLVADDNFWLNSYTGTAFSPATTISKTTGYIIELPSGFETENNTISYISGGVENLGKDELTFSEDTYTLQANPSLAPYPVNTDDLAENDQYVYQLNAAHDKYVLVTGGEAFIAPFESVITIQTPNPAVSYISLNSDVVTGKPNIETGTNNIVAERYYNLQGVEIAPAHGGIFIKKTVYQSGAVSISKIIKK